MDDDKRIDGVPVKTIRALLKSSKTPAHLKDAWRMKLKRAKLGEVS